MGWAAITRLLAQGRSLSGREPNSCFLNLGNQDGVAQFADVSAATGFNFSDDSRALGFVDWDFDGDQDIWMLNRTAPSVRFLQNNQQTGNHFVAFHLKGVSSNRNAIGARITLTTQDEKGKEMRQIRTVTTGGSYLSQSSFWMHFGLGKHHKISSVTIRWPKGAIQNFEELEINQFYQIPEGGEPKKRPRSTKTRSDLKSGPLVPPALSNAARMVLGNRPLFPPYQSELFSNPSSAIGLGKASLVSLWSAECPHCHDELKEWTQEADSLEEAGFKVTLLNVDPKSIQKELVRKKQQELSLPFEIGLLAPEEVGAIDAYQQAISAIHLPLMTPTSFLLDEKGRVCVVYRGAVSAHTIIEDLSLVGLNDKGLIDSSVPYQGRWWKTPRGADPNKIALKMHDDGLTKQGIRYLQAEIENMEGGEAPERIRPLFELYFSLGRLFFQMKRQDKAIEALKKAVALNPRHLPSVKDLGRMLYEAGELNDAIPYIKQAISLEPKEIENRTLLIFSAMRLGKTDLALAECKKGLKISPSNSDLHFSHGLALQSMSRWTEALQSYEKAVRLNPQLVMARNNMAWILATAPDELVRNGKLSRHLIEPLLKLNIKDRPLFLRTAAAGAAELGDFETALRLLADAQELASSTLEPQLKVDRSFYSKKEPYRSVESK